MALSEREKEIVVETLDDMDAIARRLVLASLDAFSEWFKSTLYSLYLKIKASLARLFSWLVQNCL